MLHGYGPTMVGHCDRIFSPNRRDQQRPLNYADDTRAEIIAAAQWFLHDYVIGYARLPLKLGSV